MVEDGGTETARRVAEVLLLFTEGPPVLGVSEVARRLGLSKAVVHRILRTLHGRGLVVTDPQTRGYRLGPAAAAIGARVLQDSELDQTQSHQEIGTPSAVATPQTSPAPSPVTHPRPPGPWDRDLQATAWDTSDHLPVMYEFYTDVVERA